MEHGYIVLRQISAAAIDQILIKISDCTSQSESTIVVKKQWQYATQLAILTEHILILAVRTYNEQAALGINLFIITTQERSAIYTAEWQKDAVNAVYQIW